MISLNYRDSRPIYEQIKDGLRKLVVTGAVRQDEKLPSVRELAASLAINPNTFSGLIGNSKTKGIFIPFPVKAPLPHRHRSTAAPGARTPPAV